MLVFSPKEYASGSSSGQRVYKIYSDSVKEFHALLEDLEGHKSSSWYGQWPTQVEPWPHNAKSTPHVKIKHELRDWAKAYGIVEVPFTYAELVGHWGKRAFWEGMWPHRATGSGKISHYWRSREHWCIHQIKKHREWVLTPELYQVGEDFDVEKTIQELKLINQRIEKTDHGQRRQVKPWESVLQIPSEDRFAPAAGDSETIKSYKLMTPRQRKNWREDPANSWFLPVLESRGLL